MNFSSSALVADYGGFHGDRYGLQVQDQGQGDVHKPSHELPGARDEVVVRIQEGDTWKWDIETSVLKSCSGYIGRNLHGGGLERGYEIRNWHARNWFRVSSIFYNSFFKIHFVISGNQGKFTKFLDIGKKNENGFTIDECYEESIKVYLGNICFELYSRPITFCLTSSRHARGELQLSSWTNNSNSKQARRVLAPPSCRT